MPKPTSNRLKIIALLAFVFLVLVIFIGLQNRSRSAPPVPAQPDRPIPTSMLPDNYSYRQDDRRWGSETIGATEDTLRAYGCTIASVAMAASNLTQSEITPQKSESSAAIASYPLEGSIVITRSSPISLVAIP